MKRNIKTITAAVEAKLYELGSDIGGLDIELESKQDRLRAFIVEATKAKKGDEIGYQTWFNLTQIVAAGLMGESLEVYKARNAEPSRVKQLRATVKRMLKDDDGVLIGAPVKSTKPDAERKRKAKADKEDFSNTWKPQIVETAAANDEPVSSAATRLAGEQSDLATKKKLVNLGFDLEKEAIQQAKDEHAANIKAIRDFIKTVSKYDDASKKQRDAADKMAAIACKN